MVSMEDERSPLRHLQTLSSLPEEEQGKSIISPEGIWKVRPGAPPAHAAPPALALPTAEI